jgi:hypothetical protein
MLLYIYIFFQVDLAVISIVDKDNLRLKLTEVTKKLKVWLKSIEATRAATVNVEVEKIIEEATSSQKTFLVTELDLGADGKLAKKIQEKFKSVCPKLSSVILSSDDDGEK